MIEVGQRLPATTLYEYIEVETEGCSIGPNAVDSTKAAAGKTVVLFALPGAFTPTCSAQHLPGYLANMDALKAKGVDEVICLSVNDPFVMKAWGDSTGGAAAGISFLADGDAGFTKAVGMDFTVPATPVDKPRYLMGVGKPSDLLGAVERGVDMFDCVIPTRSGRNARAYTSMGEINLRNARHADDPRPLDAATHSPINRYSRAYLHHLFKADEMLGPMLLTQHNLHYYQELMAGIRASIASAQFEAHAAALREGWKRGDLAAL